jgi:glutathione S-transferase
MSELTLVIGNKNYSSWSLRPWLLLKVAGIPFREVKVLFDQPDTASTIARYSPSGRVPVLIDGAQPIWDSLAIAEYVAERFPEAGLWPADRALRAKARSISAEMHSGFQALRNSLNMDIRGRYLKEWGADVQTDIDRILAIWKDCRSQAVGGRFLFGRFSIADAMYAPVATRFRTWPVKLDDVSAAYRDEILALPAFREWESESAGEPVVHRYQWTGPRR